MLATMPALGPGVNAILLNHRHWLRILGKGKGRGKDVGRTKEDSSMPRLPPPFVRSTFTNTHTHTHTHARTSSRPQPHYAAFIYLPLFPSSPLSRAPPTQWFKASSKSGVGGMHHMNVPTSAVGAISTATASTANGPEGFPPAALSAAVPVTVVPAKAEQAILRAASQ